MQPQRHRISNALPALLLSLLLWLSTAIALQAQQGLAGGPDLGNTLHDLQKTTTNCAKCLDQQAAYHSQVDVYNQAKAAYQAHLIEVRKKADDFLVARQAYDRDYGAFERLSNEADDLLFGDGETKLYDYRETRDKRDAAEPAARQAEVQLAKARSALAAALKDLDGLRAKALAEMRKAIRAQLAMYQCELSCDVSELDLDDNVAIGSPPKPTPIQNPALNLPPLIAASEVPKPENFIGIVAKCAACQALAEKVNTIRSHRRSIATSAEMLHGSLTANHATLQRLLKQAETLKQQEELLYKQLLDSFTPKAPGETSDRLDETFDRHDQNEAEAALRHLAEQRAQVARDAAGLTEVIGQQTKGLLAAILNYRLHTALLEAAQKELADCEKTCKPAKPNKTAIDPFVDPAYPQQENIDFILAKCPTCQPIADALMQTLSKRRSVAGDIQTEVWLLKSRRKSLKEWEAQDDDLEKEERLLSAFLVGDTGLQNEAQVLDRLFEIEDLRTQLLMDMLWAEDEIARLDKQLQANLKEHTRLTKRAEELRKELADCEAKCLAEKNKPKVSLPGDDYDRSYPVPQSFFGRLADCPTCQPLAEALNDLLKQRYVVASDLQATLARLKYNRGEQARREAELAKLLAREQELAPIWTRFDDSPEQQAAGRELDQIDLARRQAEAAVAGLKKLNAEDEEVVAALLEQHEQLETQIAQSEAALQDCEATRCADTGGGDIALAGQSPFVSTDCEPCQQIASLINDAVGTLIGAERELKSAKAKLAQLKEEAQTRADRLRAVLARESQLNEAWLTTQDEAKRAELDRELNEIDKQRNALTDAQAEEGAAIQAAKAAIAEAQKKVDDLKALIAKLKADLAECEKQCKPAQNGGQIGLGQNGQGQNGQGGAPQSPFVSTDCEPCQQIASLINDAVGTLIGAERELKSAKAKLAQLKEEAQTRADRLRAVLARESQLNEAWLTTQDEAKRAELDKELNEIDKQRNALTDAQAEEGAAIQAAKAAIAEAQKKVDDLKALIAKLKADLAECEKQCKPAQNGGQIGLGQNGQGQNGQGGPPQSPFVSTDCEPCQQIASLINDAVGTLIGAERELKTAKAKLAQLKEEAQTRADRLRAVLARESQLNEAWLTTQDEAKRAELDKELNEIDKQRNALTDAQAEEGAAIQAAKAAIAEAQKKVDDLKALIAKLKADLAECEKQCKPAQNGGQIGLGQNGQGQNGQGGAPQSPFVSTDCEPCQQIASELNDVIGSLPGTEQQVANDKAALDALRAEHAAKSQAKAAAQEAFAQAIYAKAALSEQGQDVSAQNAIIKRELDKASDLLSEIDDLDLDILDAEEALAASSARLKLLKARETALRKQLADCELEACKIAPKPALGLQGAPAKPLDPIKVLLSKLQSGTCTSSVDCDFEIKVTNPENQDWLGPLFVLETRPVHTQHPDWHCSPASSGTSLCFTDQGPGARRSLRFIVRMPVAKNQPGGQQNCIELKIGSDGKILMQMLQAGLAAKGFAPGPADGIAGRKTKRALAAFADASGQELSLDRPAQAYQALFGAAPLASTNAEPPRACSAITTEDASQTPSDERRPKIRLEIDLQELLRRQEDGQELTPDEQEQLELEQQEDPSLQDKFLKKKKPLVPLPKVLLPLF